MNAETHDAAPISGVIGVALAGGASRRMGHDKARLLIGGEPLLGRAVARLRRALAVVIVVGNPALVSLVPETRIVADAWPGRGPLGALVTALEATETTEAPDAEWALLVACDMPFTQPALVREIARLALTTPAIDAVALRGPRGLEPLHAAYHRRCLPLARARLAAGDDNSLQGLLATLRVREVTPDDARRFDPFARSAFNANTPEEWSRALRLADEESERA
ncbi:MAG TPA: molybdenum cofactor guanylyltransferase [Ktedonobacterales bacterium]|nr:molybdenum cofactor guanylyltransferase [Ktedonobacterales bacterium]